MALEDYSRQSLIPSYFYSSASSKSLFLEKMLNERVPSSSPSLNLEVSAAALESKNFMIESPSEPGQKIAMYSPAFYAACTAGGILSCGLTHMTVTPLDLVKCNMQVLVCRILYTSRFQMFLLSTLLYMLEPDPELALYLAMLSDSQAPLLVLILGFFPIRL